MKRLLYGLGSLWSWWENRPRSITVLSSEDRFRIKYGSIKKMEIPKTDGLQVIYIKQV